jgi:hypothetical protein
MDSNVMSEAVSQFFNECNLLQWKKNSDYHPDKIAFLEIMRTASECNITVEQDLWAKIRKQYIALRSYVIDGHVESESPRSRMMDVAVYMGMLAVWDQHKKSIVRDGLKFIERHTSCEREQGGDCNIHNTQLPICDRCRFLFWLSDRAR